MKSWIAIRGGLWIPWYIICALVRVNGCNRVSQKIFDFAGWVAKKKKKKKNAANIRQCQGVPRSSIYFASQCSLFLHILIQTGVIHIE